MASELWCRTCGQRKDENPTVKWRKSLCEKGDPMCGDLAAPYCDTCWKKKVARHERKNKYRKAQAEWLQKWYQKEHNAHKCNKCGKLSSGEFFGNEFLCDDCIVLWQAGKIRPHITNVAKLVNVFYKKATETCPECGGEGFRSEDKWHPYREHYTEETKCQKCKGKGYIESEEKEEAEPIPEPPGIKAKTKELLEKTKAHVNKMKEENKCPVCEGSLKSKTNPDAPCVFCNPTGYPKGTWDAYQWKNQQRKFEEQS